MRVQGAVRSEVLVGQEGKHDEGQHQELEGILELGVGHDLAGEGVDGPFRPQQHRRDDGERRRQGCVVDGHGPEKVRGEERDLGGRPRVGGTRLPVPEEHQGADDGQTGNHRPRSEERGRRPDQAHQGEAP